MPTKHYSTITKDTLITICIAYPDIDGIETRKGLNHYEATSQGLVELCFTRSKQEAIELLKTFQN